MTSVAPSPLVDGTAATPSGHRIPGWWWAVAAVAGAVPTLVSVLWGPSLLVDDWNFASGGRTGGFVGLMSGIDHRSRPLQALYHATTFTVFGAHPVPHLLALAALNGLVAALVLLVSSTVVSRRLAVLVTASWVVLANHGATRLWIATGPVSVSLALLLVAAWFAFRPRPRLVAVVALTALSTLSYEGGIVVSGVLVLVAAWRGSDRTRTRVRDALAGGLTLVAVAGWVLLTTPKQLQGSAPFEPGRVLSSGVGLALLPQQLRPWSVVVLLGVLATLATAVVPAFRREGSVVAAIGAGVLACGAAPFVFARFPLSTDGMLDRVNVYLALGTALLVAGMLDQLWRLPRPAALALTTTVLVVLAAANVQDVRDAHRAAVDGRVALHALDRWIDENGALARSGPVVIAPMPNRGGWAAFGYDSVGAAHLLDRGEDLDLHDTLLADEFARAPGIHLVLVDGSYHVLDCARSPDC